MVSKVKRVLAGLLAVCMCMSMVTVTTFAAEEPVSVETSLGVVSGTQKTEVGQPVPIADGVESVTVTITDRMLPRYFHVLPSMNSEKRRSRARFSPRFLGCFSCMCTSVFCIIKNRRTFRVRRHKTI